jgi:ribosome-associated protein
VPASTKSRHLAQLAAEAALDKLATDVTLIDVSSKFPLSDMFVIASAANNRQVKAVCEGIEKALSLKGVKPLNREGQSDSHWILLDYEEIVVHVQLAEDRDYYSIERLWKDCPIEVVNG